MTTFTTSTEEVEGLEARLRVVFGLMDRNGDGQVTKIEAIKALRASPELRELLGLGLVRQEDGEEFEWMFQRLCDIEDRACTLLRTGVSHGNRRFCFDHST